MEKEHQPDSMATITMKPEYPPSEVYSTSEPPPAYRQGKSNSVQIARIAAITIVVSSFILGSFILASSWVSARSSCHQLEQLDAMLDKELALEGRPYGNDGLLADEPLPLSNAHALHGVPPTSAEVASAAGATAQVAAGSLVKEDPLNHAESKVDEDKLQKIDEDNSKNDAPNSDSNEDSSDSDSSAEDEELDAIRPLFKLPIQFDLDDLAGAFLANTQQKGRMNCVVERRHEEPMERRFPFNILGALAPRSSQSERVAIICHGGDEPRMIPEPQSQVFAFPLSGPVRLPIRPQPERQPSTVQQPPAMPRLPFAMPQQRPGPFPMPLPWDSSEEQMNAPREMRIHVQRVIAIPAPHNMPLPENMGPFAPPPLPPQQQEQNEPTILHQYVPQSAPTQDMEQPEVQKMDMDGNQIQMNLPWGLTPEDIQVIHRTAEDAAVSQSRQQQMDNDMQEVKAIVNTLTAADEAEIEAQADSMRRQSDAQDQQQEEPSQRVPRTLLLPQEPSAMEDRPHYMQPRSVRSVDALLHREKRVKRCACDCH